MEVSTTVFLSISDFCLRVPSPPQFVGLLFGHAHEVTESCEFVSSDLLAAEIASGERLELMRSVNGAISVVGAVAVGYGLEPSHAIQAMGQAGVHEYLMLIDLAKQEVPVCKAFRCISSAGLANDGVHWTPTEIKLVSDEATSVAVSDALTTHGSSDTTYAKRILRDKISGLQRGLVSSSDDTERAAIIQKYGQLMKTALGRGQTGDCPTADDSKDASDEIVQNEQVAYELMARVIQKSDDRHRAAVSAHNAGTAMTDSYHHHTYV